MSQNNRSLADDTQYAVRRIPPHSSCWRPHPGGRMTTGAFSGTEVSVDLFDTLPTDELLKSNYSTFIEERGVGFAISQVSKIRETVKSANLQGDVYKDPIENNQIHGIITGQGTEKKKTVLRDSFELKIEPKPFS